MQPARHVRDIKYAIRDIVVKAHELEAQGKDIIYMNTGDPPVYEFDTPQHIKDVLKAKIDERLSATYANSIGILEAREAVAKEYGGTTDDVVITAGVSEGINIAIAALVNPGENVLVPNPGYPLYKAALTLFHGNVNEYLLREKDWQPDVSTMVPDEKTRAIVVINPNNPTGAVYTEEALRQIIDVARRHKLILFADEIYDKLLLDKHTHIRLHELADVPVVCFGGLSKNYIMPGYRVGWIYFHDPHNEITAYKESVKQLCRSRLSAPHLQQHAIKAALEGNHDFLEPLLSSTRQKRDFTVRELNSIDGMHCATPHGAFYAFPRIELPPAVTDKEYVEGLLKEEGVVVVYGSGFGAAEREHDGKRYGYFRIVYLADMPRLQEAYTRIRRYTEKFYKKHQYVPLPR